MKKLKFLLLISSLLTVSFINSQNNILSASTGFCSDTGINFENSINTNAEVGPNYGCLTTQPNPAWFFIKVDQPGDLSLQIEQNTLPDFTGTPLDVDFIAWGAFTEAEIDLIKANDYTFLVPGNQVGCSYSGNSTENLSITNAQAGEYYLILLTNFENRKGYIRMVENNPGGSSTGTTDCSIVEATLGPDQKICNGTKVTLDATPSVGNATGYKWFIDIGTGFLEIGSASNNPILSIEDDRSGTYKVELTDEDGDVISEEVEITFYDIPTAKEPENILQCDIDRDGFYEFNLNTLKDSEILDTQLASVFEVLYFTDPTDATNNVTANALTFPYRNPTAFSSQTIYARVHNKEAPEACFAITDFTLGVIDIPIANNVVYRECDDVINGGNTDGYFNNFILSSKNDDVLGNLSSTTYNVSYHKTPTDANTSTSPIDPNIAYRNATINSETIYVRVENKNNPLCFDATKTLTLIVDKIPIIINNIATIKQCISVLNQNTTINLPDAELNISDNPNGTFEYYEDQAGTTIINNFANYPVVVNVAKTVWVKTISEFGCSDGLTRLDIQIAPENDNVYNNTFSPICDDFLDANGDNTPGNNSDTDNITDFPQQYFDDAINGINAPANTIINFYETDEDRANTAHPIEISDYRNDKNKIQITNTANGIQFPIFYKITSTINNDCQGLGQIYFQINSVPRANTPTNFNLCDDDTSGSTDDGENVGINLVSKIDEIFAGTNQDKNDFTITFHKSAAEANDITNTGIPNDTNYRNDAPAGFVVGQESRQTIYVRIVNNSTGCFNDHIFFDIVINPLPRILEPNIPPVVVCDTGSADGDPRNGLAQGIDISITDPIVLAGRDPDKYRVSYHRTLQNSIEGILSLNKTNYASFPASVTIDPITRISTETLFISIENIETGCRATTTSLDVIVNPEPNIPPIIDNYSDCDHNNNGLGDDTDGIIETISLITQTSKVLANYPEAEHNNFKVTYHTSKEKAESGDDAIDENQYTNLQNNQVIYVRVQDNTTLCVNDNLSFEIIINPLPTFDEIDTPQIVCLNDLPLTITVQNPLTLYNYSWTDVDGNELSNSTSVNITKGGTYKITATDKDAATGCSRVQEFTINESNIATLTETDISIIDDSSNNSITIDTSNLGIGDYEFALFDKVTNTFIVDYQDEAFFDNLKGGIYSIYVRDKNGCDINNIPVQIEVPIVEFIKFFTPNGDGKNDVWTIKGVNGFFFPGSTIYIFNRYGKVVGNISVNNNTWDGTYRGKPLPSDDYWFNIQLINKDGTARKPRKGHFSLLRPN